MKLNNPNNQFISELGLLGRLIYHSQIITDFDIKSFYSKKVVDEKTGKLISRHIEIECFCIKDLIKNQQLIDISLCHYLEEIYEKAKVDNTIYTTSFSLSYKFPNFISNTENIVLNTSTSQKPYRIAEVKTLGAYTNMEYNCWNNIDNNKIKLLFKGQYNKDLSDKEDYAFSQIISLFTCEASRNPTTYITAPMVLELAEYFYYYERREDKKELALKLSQNQHQEIELNQYLTEIEILKEKSSTIKMCFERYFPMAIKNAVSGSRFISNEFNKYNEKYFHQYDNGRQNIKEAIELINKNKELTYLWKESFPDRQITDLVQDWYDIDLIGENELII